MYHYLSQQSDSMIFFLTLAALIIMSLFSMLIVKRFIVVKETHEDNAVTANISSIIGVIYGVLAGLSALYLLNNIDYTNQVVQREASAAANIYQVSKFIKEPTRSEIQKQLQQYLNIVIQNEWPLMKKGEQIKDEDNNVTDEIVATIIRGADTNIIDSITLHDMLTEIKALNNAREERIQLSMSSLSIEIWVVVLIGTFLTIGINFFFKMSYRLHLIAIFAEITMLSSMIFLLITLDTPFQGEYVVQPLAFQSLLNHMQVTNAVTTVHR